MLSNKVRVALRILIIIALLFGFAVAGVYIGYNYVISQDKRFNTLKQDIEDGKYDVKADTEGAVTIVVKSGDSTSDIAEKLYDQGLITNKFLFSIISKLNGFDGAYVAGTHYLLKGYSYDEIMYFLTLEPAAVKVTIPEGSTYYEIKKILHDAGLSFDDEEFDKCMNSPNLFVDYEFVSQIEIKDGRDFILSGYLYPDTYYFDVNASPESIIRRFLNNMRNKLYDEYYARAKKLGMTMDEVITLASVIQMETGKPLDMLYVSAVFHNRLKSDDLLSCIQTASFPSRALITHIRIRGFRRDLSACREVMPFPLLCIPSRTATTCISALRARTAIRHLQRISQITRQISRSTGRTGSRLTRLLTLHLHRRLLIPPSLLRPRITVWL